MPYRSPVSEYRFLLDHVVPLGPLLLSDRFGHVTGDLADAVLTAAARVCDEVLAPLNRAGDRHPARLENGVVRTAPGFAEGFRAIADAGLVSMSAPSEYGGLDLPESLGTAVNEMMSGACMALQLNPLLTQGQIAALAQHASDGIKALYLPKLISGEWSGTMNLTEPQAGSDVGALSTRAEDAGDGTYRITGQKIFITWGDSDVTSNVCHLVLARLPGAPAGTKGISLFLVPKFIPDSDGKPGRANDLKVVSVEHKMGVHGSPTCVMAYAGATGWLVGDVNGRGRTAVGGRIRGRTAAVWTDPGPSRCASHACRDEGRCLCRAGDCGQLRDGNGYGPCGEGRRLGGARGVSDADCQGVLHGRGLQRHRNGDAGPWRDGVYRRDGRGAVLPRRAHHADL